MHILIGLFLFIAPTLALAQATAPGVDTSEITDPNNVSLRDYLNLLINERDRQYDQRFQAQQQSVDAALAAADKATNKADEAIEKRFDSVNEFRQTLSDQALNFANKQAVEAALIGINDKIDGLTTRLDRIQGTDEGITDYRGFIYAAVGVLISIALLVLAAATFIRKTPTK